MNIEQMSIFICKRLVVFNVFSTFEKKLNKFISYTKNCHKLEMIERDRSI